MVLRGVQTGHHRRLCRGRGAAVRLVVKQGENNYEKHHHIPGLFV